MIIVCQGAPQSWRKGRQQIAQDKESEQRTSYFVSNENIDNWLPQMKDQHRKVWDSKILKE